MSDDLKLIAAYSLVRDGRPINPGDPFLADSKKEYDRFIERQEAFPPKAIGNENRKPETPEHRRRPEGR